ncbi:MAG: multicopper oxidase domain-containing protein, partial [Burkholderiales bacterium]|nr:multicopper oxidase domain-containing protein [Burkholderiales bacterium]
EGDEVVIRVTNTLREVTSIHWHGLLVPNSQDGVPGVTFPGIAPGETFTYRFKLHQSGTYWYHSHAGLQEAAGMFAPLIIDPIRPDPFQYEREYIVMLSDWNDTPPAQVLANLKKVDGYYNYRRITTPQFLAQLRNAPDAKARAAIWKERMEWARMRMDPTDYTDGGPEWTSLLQGMTPAQNWTALFKPGERVRLRFINASAMNFYDVRIPGLPMTVVQADGQNVRPVEVDEFRIGNGETYDVIVQPGQARAYTLFAPTMARVGHARGTLAPELGMSAPVPPMGPPPVRTMADMGMTGMDMGGAASDMAAMPGMPATPASDASAGKAGMAGMEGMAGMDLGKAGIGQPGP